MKQFSIAALLLTVTAFSISSADAAPNWYDLVEKPSWIKKTPKVKGNTLEQRKIAAANMWLKDYFNDMNVRLSKEWRKPPKGSGFAGILCSINSNGNISNLHLPPTSESQAADSAAIAAVMNIRPMPMYPEGAPRQLALFIEFDPGKRLPRTRIVSIEAN